MRTFSGEIMNAYYNRDSCTAAQLSERVDTLAQAIAHGTPEHREWLKAAITEHLAGRPVPEESSTTERKAP
jgi:hypothetical protein